MTINNRHNVNNMCKKFIKTCQVYPCINTSMHTSRSPKSADRSDGLAYNKSQAGREALSLCSQLGAYHTGPMGPTIHNRVSVGTYPNPTPGQPTLADFVLGGGVQQNITGDHRTPGQDWCCGSPAIHRQLHIPDFSGGKERGDRDQ